jgi:hypothetical protein
MEIKQQTQKPPDDDTAEEIIGILTAISVVSKRLAKKLRLLEQETGEEKGEKRDEQDE